MMMIFGIKNKLEKIERKVLIMSEEKEVYQVEGSEPKKHYDDMKSMDEVIRYYGIDNHRGCFKDFKDPAISNALDDIIRVINSYVKYPDEQQGYKLTKMKNALNSLTAADEKISKNKEK